MVSVIIHVLYHVVSEVTRSKVMVAPPTLSFHFVSPLLLQLQQSVSPGSDKTLGGSGMDVVSLRQQLASFCIAADKITK